MEIFVEAKSGAKYPFYATLGSAGMDITACIENPITIQPFERVLIPTGLCIQIPEGYEIQLRPRSGLALREGITLLNSPATIDSDFRDEIKVLLINFDNVPHTIEPGERIVQAVLAKYEKAIVVAASKIDRSFDRGGGFGHTGKY